MPERLAAVLLGIAQVDPTRSLADLRREERLRLIELLDAFGPIGGYNFLWAWATGRAAGSGATRS